MKYLRCLVLLIVVVFLSGCSVTYNLTIDTDVDEEIFITPAPDYKKAIPLNQLDYQDTIAAEGRIDNIKYYSVTNDESYTKYAGTFKPAEFSESTACNEVFEKCEFRNTGGGISVLSTTSGTGIFIGYPELDVLNINITITGEVISNNADSVNGNTYSWKITKDNAESKNIYLEFKGKVGSGSNIGNNGKDEEDKTKENIIYLGILLAVLVVILVILVLANKKKFKQ